METLKELGTRLLNGWQLSKLYTFEVAARHESFALAAEELSLTPSAVSHRINQLEEELGIQLFVRSHRKVELTHEGKRVFWALKSSLDSLNQEILDIKNQELSGTLTVYSRPSIAQCWLVPALGDFTRRYPSISLTVLTGNDNVNMQRAGIDPGAIEDVLMGCDNPEGATGANIARQIALRAGLPTSVAGMSFMS